MKKTFAYGAMIAALIGMAAGVSDWALSNFLLDTVNWEGPLYSLQLFCWFISYIGFGCGIALAAMASITNDAS